MLRQSANLEPRFVIEKTSRKTWRTHRYINNFEGQIGVKLSTSNLFHSSHVDLPFINDEISMDFQRRISMSNQW